MTTTLYANAEAIRAEARKLDPVKALITLLLIVPFVIGWTARITWVVIALLWTGCVYGWRSAAARVDAGQAGSRTG